MTIEGIEKIMPELERLEVERKKVMLALRHRKVVSGIAVLCIFAVFVLIEVYAWNNDFNAYKTGMAAVAAIFGLSWWEGVPERKYAREYKSMILPVISQLYGDLAYVPDGKIPIESLLPFGLIPRYSRYRADDYFKGTYRGNRIEIAEIEFSVHSLSVFGTHDSLFKGLAVLVYFPTNLFKAHTAIVNWAVPIFPWHREKRLSMPLIPSSPNEDKYLRIYGTDETEARALAAPDIIESIKEMRRSIYADAFRVSFLGHAMLIMIQTDKNFYEPADIKVSAADSRTFKGMKAELDMVFNFIDRLSQKLRS